MIYPEVQSHSGITEPITAHIFNQNTHTQHTAETFKKSNAFHPSNENAASPPSNWPSIMAEQV